VVAYWLDPYDSAMPQPPPVLRTPRAGDGSRLARIWLDGAASFAAIDPSQFQVPSSAGLAEWPEDRALHSPPEDTYMQVAEIDGVVVGHIWAVIRPPDVDAARLMQRDEGVARLSVHWLGVADGYRRQGVGARLLQAAEAWSIPRGARAAGFSTYLGAPATVAFYERRMGYTQHAVYLRKSLA
jgi:GNAT superfamily N-acetyltransferase